MLGAIFTSVAASVNGGVERFAHGLQFAMLLAMTTNVLQFVNNKCADRQGSHCHVNLSVYLLSVATVLMLTQPFCLFMIDCWSCEGIFSADQLQGRALVCKSRSSEGKLLPLGCDGFFEMDGSFHSSRPGLGLVRDHSHDMFPTGCSRTIGDLKWITKLAQPMGMENPQFLQYCTFGGIGMMFVAMVLATKLHTKFIEKIRG